MDSDCQSKNPSPTLQRQQRPLARQAAAKAGEAAVAANHAAAGHDDGHLVLPVGRRYGADGGGATNGAGCSA